MPNIVPSEAHSKSSKNIERDIFQSKSAILKLHKVYGNIKLRERKMKFISRQLERNKNLDHFLKNYD